MRVNDWRTRTRSPWPIDAVEARALASFQRRTPWRAAIIGARWLSLIAEHSAAWLVLSALAALIDRAHWLEWIAVGVGTLTAHIMATLIKVIVRRPRPHSPDLEMLGTTLSRLSFPSSHLAGTTAFAVGSALIMPMLWWAAVALIAAMAVARLRLGVHYPSDVAAGAALGAATALVAAWIVR